MCEGCCVRVWEVSAINRFIYASSVQQPNARLLGSDSEYSSIKRSSDTQLTHMQTHMSNDFCQSHADVQSIPEACHECSGRGEEPEERCNEWPQITEFYNLSETTADFFFSSNNLVDMLLHSIVRGNCICSDFWLLSPPLCAVDAAMTATHSIKITSFKHSRITQTSHEQVPNGRWALAWSENMVDEWKPWELPDWPLLFSDNSQLSDVEITDRKRGLWSLMEPWRPCWNDIHGLYLHKHNCGGYFGTRQIN